MQFLVYVLYLYFFVFIFGQLSKFTLQLPQINLYLTDLIVGFLVGTWVFLKLFKKEKFKPPLFWPILTFSIISIISLLINSLALEGRELIVSWLYLGRWTIYSGLYFVIYDLMKNKVITRKKIEKILIICGLSFALFGLIQYFLLPDTRFLENWGWDPHYYRLIGTFFDPGFTGAILAITLAFVIKNVINANIFKEKAYFVAAIILYVSLALTYSRASYLLYLIELSFLFYFCKKQFLILVMIIVGVLTIFLLPRPGGEGVRLERESTIIYRIINWQQSSQIILNKPLIGVGFNAYRFAQRDNGFLPFSSWQTSHSGGGADSSLLFVFATTGIFGLIAYLWLYLKALFLSFKSKDYLICAIILGLLAHSMFVNSLFYPWIMSWIWIIFAFVQNEKNY